MLEAGMKAPAVALPTAEMNILDIEQYRGNKNLVLYFYPRDDTPGCTMEAIEFSELADEFAALETVVIGISRDTCISHAAFRDKYGLTVELLADVDGKVCEDYSVMHEKEVNGEKKVGILRSTFIIDKDGVIRHAFYGVTPKGHAQEILEKVRDL